MTARKPISHVLTLLVCLGLLVIATSGGAAFAATPSMITHAAGPLVTPIEGGLLIAWQSTPLETTIQPSGTLELRAPGFDVLETPGAPRVPVASVLVALPDAASPELVVTSLDEEYQALQGRIPLAAKPDGVLQDKTGQPIGPAYSASQAIPFTTDPLAWEYLGRVRGVPLARISFYPVLPIGDQLRLVHRVEARFMFHGAAAGDLSFAGAAQEDPILGTLRDAVANPGQITPPLSRAYDVSAPQATGSEVIVEVDRPGVTALAYASLQEAGFPVAQVNPKNLHLSHAGVEVAMEWEGDTDNIFEPGERLLFYADPQPNRWALFDTYLLSESASPGMRMTTRNANPGSVISGDAFVDQSVEQNLYYSPQCYCGPTPLGRDGDRWVWQALTRPGAPLGSFTTSLSNVDLTRTGRLTVYLIGNTDLVQNPDHRVQAFFNAALLGEYEWDGKQAVEVSYDLPVGSLRDGVNELALNLPGISGVSNEGMWLDAFTIRYALGSGPVGESLVFFGEQVPRSYHLQMGSSTGLRAYQVTDPVHPVRLTGLQVSESTMAFKDPDLVGPQQYVATTANGILSPARLRLRQSLPVIGQAGFNGADYLVIVPQEFAPAVTDLINFRSSGGLTARLQTLQPIFDHYTMGIPDPEGIRLYLKEAYENWPKPPVYVLLVGDGNYDPKHYQDSSWTSYIPPYLADVDPWAGETAADNRFVAVDGEDVLPDMLIGRLPVESLAEAQAMVSKIIAYETIPQMGTWGNDVVFIADDPDSAGDFIADLDDLASNDVPSPFAPQRVFYTPPGKSAVQMHDEVLSWLNYGSNITVYAGHSSPSQWAVESFLHMNDVAGLRNQTRMPVLLESTCFTGMFQLPNRLSLDETLFLKEDGGAAAVWGSSSLGLSVGQRVLMDGFLKQVYVNQQLGIGEAALQGKLLVSATFPAYMDLVDTFNLLGDPAMKIGQPVAHQDVFLPIIQR